MFLRVSVHAVMFSLMIWEAAIADVTIKGRYVLAADATQAYLKGSRIPARLRDLSHYDLLFYERADGIHVEYIPHKVPADRGLFGCNYAQGIAMDFTVAKDTYKVIQFRPCI